MRIDEDIASAASGWVGKASMGIDDVDMASDLQNAHELILDGIDTLRNEGSYPDAIAGLSKAQDILNDLDDEHQWSGSSYYRCIYEGGDGGGYESGYYKKANKKVTGHEINNTLDAIQYIIDKAYEESDTLTR